MAGLVLGPNLQWRVRRIGGDPGEKGLLTPDGIDPVDGFFEEDIGAVAGGFDERAVVFDGGAEVRVAGRVAVAAGVV